jgi:hypothetical protein
MLHLRASIASDAWYAVEACIEAQDLRDPMVLHDRDVDSPSSW